MGCMSKDFSLLLVLISIQPWVIEEEQSLPILKAAWDRGINTIDTANVYSNGESEKIVATFIEKV